MPEPGPPGLELTRCPEVSLSNGRQRRALDEHPPDQLFVAVIVECDHR